MNTILIISIAYVLNVFFNRWLNKIVYKQEGGAIVPFMWFIPIITTIALLFILLESKKNWFTGKHW